LKWNGDIDQTHIDSLTRSGEFQIDSYTMRGEGRESRPDAFALDVTVPVGARATVHLPAEPGAAVAESGQPAAGIADDLRSIDRMKLAAGRGPHVLKSGTIIPAPPRWAD
jgi:hypothetical protein